MIRRRATLHLALGLPLAAGLTPWSAQAQRKKDTLALTLTLTLALALSLKLPPTPCARQGGEVIAAMLAKVGIVARQESVDWAQWLSGVYGQKAYDLTIISHVEPLDLGNFACPGYDWNHESPKFSALWAQVNATADTTQRLKLLGDVQRLVAEDAVAAYLYQPTWITVAKAGLKGWTDMPIFANDLSALRWS